MYLFYYFAPDGGFLQIAATRRPNATTGPWVIGEYDSSTRMFIRRSFPEITWAVLKEWKYVGKLPVSHHGCTRSRSDGSEANPRAAQPEGDAHNQEKDEANAEG